MAFFARNSNTLLIVFRWDVIRFHKSFNFVWNKIFSEFSVVKNSETIENETIFQSNREDIYGKKERKSMNDFRATEKSDKQSFFHRIK